MIIESGVIIFLGLILIAIKFPLKTNLRLLGHPLAVDITASVIVYILHYGTFTGVMAAAVAGLMTSAVTSGGRKVIGYIDPKTKDYVPGWFDVSHRLEHKP